MVVATPTITNSVSFDKPKHFNTVMAFLTNMSCIPPDAFQACGRVRHPDSDVVHLYTASCLGGAGNAKAVKSYAELTSEAKLRDARATEMEKLCYKLASRARLFSFNFHDEYLEACFRVCGYAVRVRGVTVGGEKALMKQQDAPPPPPLDEVHRTTAEHFSGVVKRVCETMDAATDDADARAALDVIGAPFDAEEAEPGAARRALSLIRDRHLFAAKLLCIESPDGVAASDVRLTEDQRAARDSLWVAFSRKGRHQSSLWAARKVFLYEQYTYREGLARGTMPEELLRSEFQNSAVTPWKSRFSVLSTALAAVGLRTAVPTAGAACSVTRATLGSADAYEKLVKIVPDYNKCFSGKPMAIDSTKPVTTPEARASAAADVLKTVVNAWNPKVTFKAASRKRRRGEGGQRQETGDFHLAFVQGSNVKGEMELLHSMNLRL